MDLQEAFDAGFDAVKRYVDRSFDEFSATIRSLKERVDSLEGRQPQKGDRGEKGDPGIAGKDGRDGIDGKDGTPGEKGDRGDPGKDGEKGEKGDTGEAGPAGPKGEKGDPGEPGPQGAPGTPGIAGKDGKDGRDGADITGGTVDRQGHLILTLSNGETKDFGPVVGRDGVDGKDGEKGEPGQDGKNGRDGFGFDDLDLHVSEDGAFLRFMRGSEVKEFRLPIVMDRGVYSSEKTYRPGDGVTWGGSFWIAQEETADKPDSGKGWRLAVKKGRDGKDGILKPEQPIKVKV